MAKGNITQIRARRETVEIIDKLKYKGETRSQVLDRILRDYDKYGVRRELFRLFSDLEVLTGRFIHPDVIYILEMMRAILLLILKEEDMLKRAEICNNLQARFDEILKTLKTDNNRQK